MLFTKLGRGLAILALLIGLYIIFFGLFVASVDDPVQRAAAASRYLGGGLTGEHIDLGIYMVFCAIALGVATDISRSLASSSTRSADYQKPTQKT